MTSSLPRHGAATLALAFALAAGASAAQAAPPGAGMLAAPDDNKAEALKRYNRGVELSKEGDARSALIEFRRAYELLPNYRVLYNMGQMSYELQDYVGALRSFEQYLRDGGKEIQKKRRGEVEKEIEKLKARVASTSIKVEPAGAEVSVDDVVVGKAPLDGPVLLNPGKRKVSASASGRRPGSKTIEVAGGDTPSVELKLEEEKAPEPPPAPPPPPPPPASIPWVAWGVTGALAVSTAVVGVLALRASSHLSEQRDSLPVTRDDLLDSRDRMRTLAVTTDILGGATLIAGAVSTYLTLRRPSPEGASTSLRIGPAGVSLGGRF